MQTERFDITGSFVKTFTTGAITGIAAGTATAGHLAALQWTDTVKVARIRAIELEALITTAFGAAQEVGFDAYILRSFSVMHTGGNAIDFSGAAGAGKKRDNYANSLMLGRVAAAAALTAGTHTLDTDALARVGFWAGAIGAKLERQRIEMALIEPGGEFLKTNMGLLIRNTILWGATGVGKLHVTVHWDEGILENP